MGVLGSSGLVWACSRLFFGLIRLDWIGLMDWIDGIGLDWIGLYWIELDWIGLDWIDSIALDWIELDWIGLIGLD